MTNAAPILHCLEILEKEFDKSYVDLDLLVTNYVMDEPEEEFLEAVHAIMNTMSSCFSQLCHKTQITAQSNAKLEALLLDSRENLLDAQSKNDAAQIELDRAVRQLHSSQVQLHVRKSSASGDDDEDLTIIKKSLDEDISTFHKDTFEMSRAKNEISTLKKDNSEMTKQISQMESELYGTRLAAKYLDKELAGRMQQIQLLGRDEKPSNFDRMWQQLEAEIHLHRHKTIVRACRKSNNISPKKTPNGSIKVGDVRQVVIKKSPAEGLGISITGGKEHGIPILISEIHEGATVDKSASLFVGDALLSINGEDLQNATHTEAVALLSQKVGEMVIEALYVDDEDDNESITFGVEVAAEDPSREYTASPSGSQEKSNTSSSIQSSSACTNDSDESVKQTTSVDATVPTG